ncbi:MAG: hypothetical protein Q7T08_12045, partial [Devosia sp.]|nr:hypothetical protein [Devosia sp.]
AQLVTKTRPGKPEMAGGPAKVVGRLAKAIDIDLDIVFGEGGARKATEDKDRCRKCSDYPIHRVRLSASRDG